MKYLIFVRSLIVLSLLTVFCKQIIAQTSPLPMMGDATGRPIVILKADDLGGLPFDVPHQTWERFFDVIESNSICASVGIISNNVTGGTPVYNEIIGRHNETYIDALTKEIVHRFEFWNHTASHPTLTNYSVSGQQDEITNCQNFFQTTLGFNANVFAAPFNAINPDTKTAICNYNNSSSGDLIKVWMNMGGFSSVPDLSGCAPGSSQWSALSTQLQFDRNYSHLLLPVAWGDDIGQVKYDGNGNTRLDYNFFLTSVTVSPNKVTIIELHPAEWTGSRGDSSFVALQQIIDNLKSQNAIFVTPSYLYNKANTQRFCGDYYGTTTVAVNYGSMAAGYSWVVQPQTTDCSHAYVHSGANVTYNAPKAIYLSPGFTAESGATFYAVNTVGGANGARYASANVITNINSNTDSKITLYPNPSEGTFMIDFGSAQNCNASITIHNASGVRIQTINTFSEREMVDISNHPPGVYIVKVLSAGRSGIYKVVRK